MVGALERVLKEFFTVLVENFVVLIGDRQYLGLGGESPRR